MSRKIFAGPFKALDAESLAADFQSGATDLNYIDNVGITISTSGVTDNTGTFTIEIRNGENDSWQTLSLDTPMVLSNADASFNVSLNQVPFSQIRIAFAAAGGTPDGTATAWIVGKGV